MTAIQTKIKAKAEAPIAPVKEKKARKAKVVEATEVVQVSPENIYLPAHPLPPGVREAINDIQIEWRLRQRWHKAEKSLILQGKALCRAWTDGDKTAASDLFDSVFKDAESDPAYADALQPFIVSIRHFQLKREAVEKIIAKRVRTLPVYGWVKDIHGIGDGGFASLIGEAGDIGSYKSVAAVWKRMGVAVIGDIRQRRVTDADLAAAHGYSPARRSVLWNIGNGLIGGMGRGKRPYPGQDISETDWTPYQKLFVERCRYECARDPEKMPLKEVEKDGELRESYPKHAQNRAKRYVEKRFLRDLFAAWRKA